jgi:hypothetical protein
MIETITTAVLGILAALVPVFVDWLKGRIARKPQEKPEKAFALKQAEAKETLADALTARDGDAVAAAFEEHERGVVGDLMSVTYNPKDRKPGPGVVDSLAWGVVDSLNSLKCYRQGRAAVVPSVTSIGDRPPAETTFEVIPEDEVKEYDNGNE